MISKVKEFRIGDKLEVEGIPCEIESFPFRTSVCLKNIREPDVISGEWYTCKMPVNQLRHTLNYYKEQERRKNRP